MQVMYVLGEGFVQTSVPDAEEKIAEGDCRPKPVAQRRTAALC